MSFRRQGVPLRRYSLSPERYRSRAMLTSRYSVGRRFLVFSKVRVTLETPPGLRFLVPLKMTEVILSRRSSRLFCSPSTQRTASTMLDLPEPFGPTIPMTSFSKLMTVWSANDLKPFISRVLSRMVIFSGWAAKVERRSALWGASGSQVPCCSKVVPLPVRAFDVVRGRLHFWLERFPLRVCYCPDE